MNDINILFLLFLECIIDVTVQLMFITMDVRIEMIRKFKRVK